MFFEKSLHCIGIVTVQLHLHRRIGIGGAVQYRAGQPWLEWAEEIQRAQCGLAPLPQANAMLGAGEQTLILTQRVFDLAVAWQ